MRARLDRTLAVVVHAAAPEDHACRSASLPLELQPDVEGVHRAAREEVADLAGAHDDVDARGRAGLERRRRLVERRRDLADVADHHRAALLGLLAHREGGVDLRSGVLRSGAAHHRRLPFASSTGETAKMSTVMKPDFRNFSVGVHLRLVLVDEGDRRVGGREAVRVDLAVAVAGILRGDQRHVAVGAGLRLGRIVERARALARDAARLPVVVVVEAAEPAVVVHRHVEVHLVAGRAELRRCSRMNGFMNVLRCGSGLR